MQNPTTNDINSKIVKIQVDNFSELFKLFINGNISVRPEIELTLYNYTYNSTYFPMTTTFCIYNDDYLSEFLNFFATINKDSKGHIKLTHPIYMSDTTEKEINFDYDYCNCNFQIDISISDLNYMLQTIADNLDSNYFLCDIHYDIVDPTCKARNINTLSFLRFFTTQKPLEVFYFSDQFEKLKTSEKFTDTKLYSENDKIKNLKVLEKCKKCNLFLNYENILSIELCLKKSPGKSTRFIKIIFVKNTLKYEKNLY